MGKVHCSGAPGDFSYAAHRELQTGRRGATTYFTRHTTQRRCSAPAQYAQQGKFGDVLSLWNSLSAAQIQGWTNLAQNTTFYDPQDNPYLLSAFCMFQKVNGRLRTIDSSLMLANAPTSYTPPTVAPVTFFYWQLTAYSPKKFLTISINPVPGYAFTLRSYPAWGMTTYQWLHRMTTLYAAAEAADTLPDIGSPGSLSDLGGFPSRVLSYLRPKKRPLQLQRRRRLRRGLPVCLTLSEGIFSI